MLTEIMVSLGSRQNDLASRLRQRRWLVRCVVLLLAVCLPIIAAARSGAPLMPVEHAPAFGVATLEKAIRLQPSIEVRDLRTLAKEPRRSSAKPDPVGTVAFAIRTHAISRAELRPQPAAGLTSFLAWRSNHPRAPPGIVAIL